MVGEIIWKKINTDGVDILRPDLGETGGVPWSLRPQAGNLDFNSNVYVCVCVSWKGETREDKNPGSYYFFFFLILKAPPRVPALEGCSERA